VAALEKGWPASHLKHQLLLFFKKKKNWTDLGRPPSQLFVVGYWIDKVIKQYEFIG
jgi:hypothetical protein